MKKFSIILANPPFSRNLHLKFLEKALDVSDKVVIVEPGQWLVQIKESGKYNKLTGTGYAVKNRINGHLKSVELNNMNSDFNIANKTVCSISCIDLTRNINEIELDVCGQKSRVSDIRDCNLVGDYRLVKSILDKCRSYNDKMIDHCVNLKKLKDYEDKGFYFVPYGNYMLNSLGSAGGGQVIKMQNRYGARRKVVKNGSFYDCYVAVNSLDTSKVYDEIPLGVKNNNPKDCVYGTKEEMENWNHLVYDSKLLLFVNICLTIDEHNNSREYTPWLVDKRYSDEDVYKKLGITKAEQDFIDSVIQRYNLDNKSDFIKNLYNWK